MQTRCHIPPIRVGAFLIALLLCPFHFLVAQDKQVELPRSAQRAVQKHQDALTKAKEDYDKAIALANEALKKELQDEMETATRAADLDLAIQLKSMLALIGQSPEAVVAGAEVPTTSGGQPVVTEGESPQVNIPRGIRWKNLNSASPDRLGMLGPFPKGAVTGRALKHLNQGSLKDDTLGVRPTTVTKGDADKYFTSMQDNSDTFWFVYLRSRSDKSEAAIKAVTREAYGRSDAPVLYLDGHRIPNNAVVEIGSDGHLLIIRHPFNNGSGHNWIQLQVTGANLLYGP